MCIPVEVRLASLSLALLLDEIVAARSFALLLTATVAYETFGATITYDSIN